FGIAQTAYRYIAVVQDVHVQVSVPIVVEKGGMGGEAGLGKAVFVGPFGKGEVPVVYIEVVVVVVALHISRIADVDVQKAIVVDIHHQYPGGPRLVAHDSCGLRNVLKLHVSLVQVESVGNHVPGEIDVGKPVVVDVPDGHPTPVIEVPVLEDVE